MDLWVPIVGVAIVCLLVLSVVYLVAVDRMRRQMEEALKGIPGFSVTHSFYAADALTGIAIDEASQRVCLVTWSKDCSVRLFGYGDILEAQVIEDGYSLDQTPPKKLGETVRSLDLKVMVNDSQNPTHLLNFTSDPMKKGGFIYKLKHAEAALWQDRLRVLIHRGSSDRVLPATNTRE